MLSTPEIVILSLVLLLNLALEAFWTTVETSASLFKFLSKSVTSENFSLLTTAPPGPRPAPVVWPGMTKIKFDPKEEIWAVIKVCSPVTKATRRMTDKTPITIPKTVKKERILFLKIAVIDNFKVSIMFIKLT